VYIFEEYLRGKTKKLAIIVQTDKDLHNIFPLQGYVTQSEMINIALNLPSNLFSSFAHGEVSCRYFSSYHKSLSLQDL